MGYFYSTVVLLALVRNRCKKKKKKSMFMSNDDIKNQTTTCRVGIGLKALIARFECALCRRVDDNLVLVR